jgi:serine protease inhibitor ecotin
MAFTMACPNFKKGLKMVSGPLGVKTYPLPLNPAWASISWQF